jgi:chitodextrinase
MSALLNHTFLLALVLILFQAWPAGGQILPPDRRIIWDPGISADPGTPDGIPVYPPGVNVKDYGAKGDGTTDDSDAILAAIQACPEFHAVFFPEGRYRISKAIPVSKAVVIRGEVDETSGLSGSLICNEDIGFLFTSGYQMTETAGMVSGCTKGSDRLVVSGSTGFQAGDYVLTDQLNDGNLVTHVGVGGAATWSSRENGMRCLGQMNRITDVSGDTLFLETPLYHTCQDTLLPQLVKISGMLEGAGIEDMHINGLYSSGSSNVSMAGVSRCWIRNVHSENADRAHFILMRAYECELSNNYLHHDRTGYGSMSYGIEFQLQSTANLVENNIFFHLHSAMMIAGGLTGSVFAYNYVTEIRYVQENTLGIDCGMHGGHPNMILLEGNVFHKLICDSYWGSNAHITAFRNHIKGHAPGTTTANIAVDIQAGNRYVNVVGNVLGTEDFSGYYECIDVPAPYWNTWAIFKIGYNSFGDGDPAGNDPGVLASLIRHGNYDYVSDSIHWEPGIPDRDLPNSLFLSSKPWYFGDLDWPPVRPDAVEGDRVSDLPAKVRFDALVASDTESPLTPPDFELLGVTGRTATLNWSFTEDDIGMDRYEIYRDGVKVHSTMYEGPWQDRSLQNLTDYSYTIRATDYAGNDDNESGPIRISTLDSQRYPLEVVNGSGSGTYGEGESVAIEAIDRAAGGYEFSQWIGDRQYLGTAWNPGTTAEVWDSVTVGATYAPVSGQDTVPPLPPPRFRAVKVTEHSIHLSWDIPADDAGVYYFSLSCDKGTGGDPWMQELDFVDTGLQPGTLYTYRLSASDLAGNTSPPVFLSVTTHPDQDVQAPTAPSNLTATALSATHMILHWDASTDNVGVSGYYVYRDSLETAAVYTTQYADIGLSPSTSYLYYVVAFDASGNLSLPSEQVIGTTLPPDTAVSLSDPHPGEGPVIFPNPASGTLWVFYDQISSLRLFDLQGQLLLESRTASVDVSSLAKGTYILHVITEDQRRYRRRVVLY